MFFITTLKGTHMTQNFSSRCVGFFETEEAAANEVEANSGDMYECDFKYAVIEKYGPGIYFRSEAVRWYEWKGNSREGRYVRCERPEVYKGICNFSIG